jgi:hypothetical protein
MGMQRIQKSTIGECDGGEEDGTCQDVEMRKGGGVQGWRWQWEFTTELRLRGQNPSAVKGDGGIKTTAAADEKEESDGMDER